MKNDQLEMVLAQLEKDLLELEDKIKALQEFVSATSQLFLDSLVKLGAALGDTVSLLKQLNDTKIGLTYTGVLKAGVGTIAERQGILDFLAGGKLTVDPYGRVKLGNDPLYKPATNRLWDKGREFTDATNTKINTYKHPIKAGVRAAIASPVGDFAGWKDASKLGRWGKGLGAAGTLITVGANADKYFHDGVQEHDWQDFGVDTGVDLATAAAATAVGAAVGSVLLPPLGTVLGAGVGFLVGWGLSAAADPAKEAIKKAYH
ncbi:hypothetical protein AB4Z18_01355 [Leifsonia sp. 2TAF2]|uniref:hypothetical protein n=1 Tax=Leifsonia sp. 2TAF2 TaxID=3233009 RepID=UPI003F9E56D6